MYSRLLISIIFFFNDTATTEIYTLSLHDALPISQVSSIRRRPVSSPTTFWPIPRWRRSCLERRSSAHAAPGRSRSEEHTSELQSRPHLVCRLLLEKKKN